MLEEREAHHLIHVLRAEVGTGVELIDGRGRLWSARIGEILGNRVRLVEVVSPLGDSRARGQAYADPVPL